MIPLDDFAVTTIEASLPIIGRRQQERVDIKEKILSAAREIVVKDGYEGVSMRKIGARIGYTAMAPYRYFADKDAILRELCLADFGTLKRSLDSIASEPDPLDRLRKMGRAYVAFARDYPNQYRLLFMTPLPKEIQIDPAQTENPEEGCYLKLMETMRLAILEGRFKPEHDDPEKLSQVFWAGLHGIVSLHIILQEAPRIEWRSLESTAETIINVVIDGFMAVAL